MRKVYKAEHAERAETHKKEGVSKPTHPLFISFPPFPDIVFFYAAIFRVV